jgi:hypothetical protein
VCRARNSGVSTECFSGQDDCLYTGSAGLQAAGITNLILETDATLVQQAVNSGDYRASLAGSLLEELDSLVSSNFNSFVCLTIPRDCNKHYARKRYL